MSDDPLDETIRGDMTNKLYRPIETRATADNSRNGVEVHVWDTNAPPDLILIEARTLIHPAELDKLKRVGFGTCHIQQPDGAMKLVSVSIVAPQVDPWESRPGPDVMFQRAKAMSNELFGSDARGKIIHDREGNLIIDDMNAIQPDETARRAAYQAAYSKTLMGQYEELQDATHNMGRVLMQDMRDLWAIVRGWFGRK